MVRILELKNVYYCYSGTNKDVLSDVNIEFEAGHVYGLIGRSGSGKTTLLSVISGLDLCTKGRVLFQGKDLKAVDRDEYRAKSIGVVFQSYNLLTNATVLENIVLSMDISGSRIKDKKKHAYELLEKVGISKEKANRKVLKLSGGEQQRVGIARALSHDPDVILADEPTGNLDQETEETIMDILDKLAHDMGKCVIVVTHSKEVSSYADEVWGLNRGKLVFIKGK